MNDSAVTRRRFAHHPPVGGVWDADTARRSKTLSASERPPTTTASERPPTAHGGFTIVEVVVAFSLLATLLAVATPLAVRHRRLLSSARDYRVAIEELSNQLERLTVAPADELESRLAELEPSEFALRHLPGAKLTGAFEAADIGRRLALEIVWDEPQRQRAPVSLSAWVFPAGAEGERAAERRQAPAPRTARKEPVRGVSNPSPSPSLRGRGNAQ
jgi:hypothetical protein